MVSNKTYIESEEKIKKLQDENNSLKRRNMELEAAFESMKKEYMRKPPAELPRFYITSDKYLQMITYLRDRIIREGCSLTDVGSILLLDKAAELADDK